MSLAPIRLHQESTGVHDHAGQQTEKFVDCRSLVSHTHLVSVPIKMAATGEWGNS